MVSNGSLRLSVPRTFVLLLTATDDARALAKRGSFVPDVQMGHDGGWARSGSSYAENMAHLMPRRPRCWIGAVAMKSAYLLLVASVTLGCSRPVDSGAISSNATPSVRHTPHSVLPRQANRAFTVCKDEADVLPGLVERQAGMHNQPSARFDVIVDRFSNLYIILQNSSEIPLRVRDDISSRVQDTVRIRRSMLVRIAERDLLTLPPHCAVRFTEVVVIVP
jgi:hypothetical protein